MTNNASADISLIGFEWTRLLGNAGQNTANAITTGSDGSIYIAGYTNADIVRETTGDLDGQIYSGLSDAFISKYNPDGTKDWTRLLGTSRFDEANALTTGSDGSIYIAGYTYGDLDGQTNNDEYHGDAFISKFNPDGTKDWTRLLGTSDNDTGRALTTGADGSIYIAGETSGDLDGPTNSGSPDAFISKFNVDGTKDWTRTLGAPGDVYDPSTEIAFALTTGSDGSIYIAGYTTGDLDGQTNNDERDQDAFISKFNADGTKDWTRLLGSYADDEALALTTGADGSIYIAGITEGDLDGQTFNGGYEDAFISKFNPDGTKEWTRLVGQSSRDVAYALTTGSDGSIYIAGSTEGDLDGQKHSGGYGDAFISKFNPDGTKDWTRLFGTNSYDRANALTNGADGSIYIAGYTQGDLGGQTHIGNNSNAFISKFIELDAPLIEITLSATSFNENIAADSIVATLSSTDANSSDTHTYTFVSGDSDTDNDLFSIEGSSLKINSSPDYETKSSYNIRLLATDSGGFSNLESFTLTVNDLNETPTELTLSATSFNENIATDSIVATISSTDADSSDTHTYTFVSGDGDTDNDLFSIDGSSLKINSSPDYETKSSYSIRLLTTDSGGETYAKAFTLSVDDLNETPKELTLSATSFNENIADDSIVATLSSTDADSSDTHTYTFVSGDGDTDNNLFSIDGSSLKINSSPDYETKSSYNIRLQVTDSGGLSYQQSFTLAVNDLYEFIATISGTSGTDNLETTSSNDSIDGGEGIDTVSFSSNFSNYSFTRGTDTLEIYDQRTTGTTDGTDTLTNIEYIKFLDQTVEESKVDVVKTYSGDFSDYKFYNRGNGVYEIETDSGSFDDITGLPLLTFTGESTTSSFRNISAIVDIKGTFDQVTGLNTDDAKMFRLYNASFKRLPDPDGLRYWIGKYSSGANDSRAVASSFLGSAEFKERYGENVSDSTYVNTLYKNVLGRDADFTGLNYWLGRLDSGAETRYEVLLGFAESAENKTLFTEMTGFG